MRGGSGAVELKGRELRGILWLGSDLLNLLQGMESP